MAKMAAELVEAKVSEPRRRRPGRAGEGAGARRPVEVCAFRPGPHSVARPRFAAGSPRLPPGLRVRAGGGGRGGRGRGPQTSPQSLLRRSAHGVEARFPHQPEQLGSGSP